MDFLKSLLEPGTIVGIIGVAIGIWGLWIGYKGKRTQVLEHQVSSTQIITNRTNNIPGLKIVVGDEFASDLISSKIEFINRGNTTIMQKDFASTAPLQIITSGHFFNTDTISKKLIVSSQSNLNPELSISGTKTLTISFEYLKPKQSFSMTVLHDGNLSIKGDLTAGKIRPFQNSPVDDSSFTKKFIQKMYKSELSSSILSVTVALFALLFVLFSKNSSSTETPKNSQLTQQIEYLETQNAHLESMILDLQKIIYELQSINRSSAPSDS